MVPGIKLVEMAFSRDKAPCCGYGSGLEISHPEIMKAMASRLVSIAADADVDILVTGCPTCRIILLENMKSSENPGRLHYPEILDIPIFLERVLP
jgi:Fe-S oxidoreductase